MMSQSGLTARMPARQARPYPRLGSETKRAPASVALFAVRSSLPYPRPQFRDELPRNGTNHARYRFLLRSRQDDYSDARGACARESPFTGYRLQRNPQLAHALGGASSTMRAKLLVLFSVPKFPSVWLRWHCPG